MNEYGKSDRFIVPEKSPNKARSMAAEGMEGRDLAKRNLDQQNTASRLSASAGPATPAHSDIPECGTETRSEYERSSSQTPDPSSNGRDVNTAVVLVSIPS